MDWSSNLRPFYFLFVFSSPYLVCYTLLLVVFDLWDIHFGFFFIYFCPVLFVLLHTDLYYGKHIPLMLALYIVFLVFTTPSPLQLYMTLFLNESTSHLVFK